MAMTTGKSLSVFELLKKDHQEVTRMMEDLLILVEENHEELMEQLYETLTEHMRLEEKYLYTELEEKGVTFELIRNSYGEHEQINHLLQEVAALDAHSEEWLSQFQKLQEIQEMHSEEEEQEVFQQAKYFLNDDELHRVTESIAREKGVEPSGVSRPRPRRRQPRLQI